MIPQKIGPYPIEREVGRGGMGVVYLGRDPRLNRPVAIKVLPDAFALDPERLARFEREARLLASLTHANIAGIYGLEEDDGKRFLALEYVEGDTLAQRLIAGALPVDETIDVCRQIAAALEAAHEAGIIHRDLKPGNVKLTPSGDVKVLDFGLARGGDGAGDSSADVHYSPTLTLAATGAGVILGTAAYMSPEQARGKPMDRRTDIWSFGALLYECLTGVQAFEGETISDSIAKILQSEADASKLPADTPPRLRQLLARCLEKDARRRLRDIGDARIELEEMQGGRVSGSKMLGAGAAGLSGIAGSVPADGGAVAAAAGSAFAARSRPAVSARVFGAAAVGIALGAIAGVLLWSTVGPGRRDRTPLRFVVEAPPGTSLPGDSPEVAISPDGRTLAYVAADSSFTVELWVRPLGSFEARKLPGTRGAALPFWSPDSRSVGFFAEGKLRRTRVDGGNPEAICDAGNGRGASWGSKDVIVFGPTSTGPLYRVPAEGGTPEVVTQVDTSRGETAHRWPCFLPDGEHFTYVTLPARNSKFDSFIGSLGSKKRETLLSAAGAPTYAAPGYLVFEQNASLMAQRFDPRTRKLLSEPFTVGARPGPSNYTGSHGGTASRNGVLAWTTEGDPNMRLVWLDREGRETGHVDIPLDRWTQVQVSPDGHRLMLGQVTGGGNLDDLWLVELERNTATRLTFEQGSNWSAVWSHDGSEIVYASNREGPRDLYRRSLNGSGTDELLYHSAVPFKDPLSWSADGQWIVMQQMAGDNGWDLLLVPAAGGEARPLIVTPFNEQVGQISPDGRWILYVSDESGSRQAYVQSFPNLGQKQQVTKTGAFGALWSPDGKEVFVWSPDGPSLRGVPVESGATLRIGAARLLFRTPPGMRDIGPVRGDTRFLATVPAEQVKPGISVAVDWREGAERK